MEVNRAIGDGPRAVVVVVLLLGAALATARVGGWSRGGTR